MANYATFYILLTIVPFILIVFWIISPLVMFFAIVIELAFHNWFINKMLFYKVANEY